MILILGEHEDRMTDKVCAEFNFLGLPFLRVNINKNMSWYYITYFGNITNLILFVQKNNKHE